MYVHRSYCYTFPFIITHTLENKHNSISWWYCNKLVDSWTATPLSAFWSALEIIFIATTTSINKLPTSPCFGIIIPTRKVSEAWPTHSRERTYVTCSANISAFAYREKVVSVGLTSAPGEQFTRWCSAVVVISRNQRLTRTYLFRFSTTCNNNKLNVCKPLLQTF